MNTRSLFSYKNKLIHSLSAATLTITLLATNLTVCYAAIDYEAESEARKEMTIESNEIDGWPDGPVVSADAAILMDAKTGTILYAKNIYASEYPASTTKLLTSLIAYETCSLDETVTFSSNAVNAITWDSSNMSMSAGDTLSVEQTLYGVLVGSANEGANALGEQISGSMTSFADEMNEWAEKLGCVNSNFVNANGLYDDNHYTCAYDLALIARSFFQFDLLSKMASTYSYQISEDNIVYSHNKLLPNRTYAYEYLVGSKTGYTDKARQTLVTCAEKDGIKLICVLLKEESPNQFTDTINLFNYGFSNFTSYKVTDYETQYNIQSSDFFDTDTDIFGNSNSLISLDPDATIILPINADFSDASKELNYLSNNSQVIASIQYSYAGVPVGKCNVIISNVNTNSISSAGSGNAQAMIGQDSIEDFSHLSASPTDDSSIADAEEQSTIYINVKHIIYWIIGIAGFLIIIFILLQVFRSYEFGFQKRRRSRRSYQKRRRGPKSQFTDYHFK